MLDSHPLGILEITALASLSFLKWELEQRKRFFRIVKMVDKWKNN